MTHKYSTSEVVELGVQIEKNGFAYYSTLAQRTQNKDVRDIYNFLAGEEKKHIATFNGILETIQDYEPPELYTDDYFAYLHNLAGEYVFTQADKGEEIAKTIKDDLKAIDMALKFEDESVTFYEAMKKLVPSLDRSIIEELIQQEKKHIEKLNVLKSTY